MVSRPAVEPTGGEPRARLDRDRVLRAALEVADEGGLGSLTIRSLAEALGVKPMSVYHHVAGKEAILDGIVDLVFAEIELPPGEGSWRAEMQARASSARAVLRRHSWAIALMESRRSPGPASLRHHDAVLGSLSAGGFPIALAGHAYALLDSYVFGFAVQEAGLPVKGTDEVGELADAVMAGFEPGQYPHLAQLATEVVMKPGYDFGTEFDFGLGLILDGLQERLDATEGRRN